MMSIVPSKPQNLHLGSVNVDLGRLVSRNTKGISTIAASYLQGSTPTRTTV